MREKIRARTAIQKNMKKKVHKKNRRAFGAAIKFEKLDDALKLF